MNFRERLFGGQPHSHQPLQKNRQYWGGGLETLYLSISNRIFTKYSFDFHGDLGFVVFYF